MIYTHTHMSAIRMGHLDKIRGLPQCQLPDRDVAVLQCCKMLLFGGKPGKMYRMALCVVS